MIYKNESTTLPERVTVETLPDGLTVVLTSEAATEKTEDGDIYHWDEVRFDLPEGRAETAESIAENFEQWWLYGQEEHEAPTLEERVALLEELLLEE